MSIKGFFWGKMTNSVLFSEQNVHLLGLFCPPLCFDPKNLPAQTVITKKLQKKFLVTKSNKTHKDLGFNNPKQLLSLTCEKPQVPLTFSTTLHLWFNCITSVRCIHLNFHLEKTWL
jgi:hypothetical protein